MSEWSIRICRPEEVGVLLDLWRQADATPSVTDTPEDLCLVLTAQPATVLVAESGGRVVGSVIGTFDGWRGHVYRLAVLPNYRRHGIARALVAEVQKRLVERGARRVIALVEKDHPPAMGFWTASGYRQDPHMVRFVQNL